MATVPTSRSSKCFYRSSLSRRQKLGYQENVDGISNLPESILVRIISFLPTTDAVKTSVLKKKWQFLWTKVFNFAFQDSGVHSARTQSFTSFVSWVLLQNNALSINKFRLKCWRNGDPGPDVLVVWLLMAVAKSVKEIYVHVPRIYLPRAVLTCETLTFLKLRFEKLDIEFPGSSCICFPSLKTLDVHFVSKMCYKPFIELLLRSPLLENLSIRSAVTEADEAGCLVISSNRLKSLRLEVDGNENAISVPRREVAINAPELEYLFVKDHTSEVFCFGSIESLVEAHISIGLTNDGLRVGENGTFLYPQVVVRESFDAFRNVKFLCLSGHTSKVCELEAELTSADFPNLTHLVLGNGCTMWLRLLPYLLRMSDNLHFLEVVEDKGILNDSAAIGRSWIKPEHTPRCLRRSLRAISVDDLSVSGSDHELAMLKYLLKKARVLETLEIHIPEVHSNTKLHEKISKFRRASQSCSITFL